MDKEQISRYVGKLCQQKLHMAADGLSIRDFDLYVAPSTAQPTRHSSLRLICRVSDDTDEFGLGMYITGLVPAQTCLLRDPVLVAVRSTNPNVTSSDLRRALMVKLFQQGYLTPKSARFRQDIRNVYDIVTPRLEAMTETEFCMINQLKAELNTRPVCSVWRQALLSDSCLINHSCAPNTKMIMRPISKEAVFISLQRLKDGNEVTISYIPFPIDCKSSRALLLGSECSFECKCWACICDYTPSLAYRHYSVVYEGHHCWWCGTATERKCSQCVAKFCSPTCEASDAPHHGSVCKRIRTLPLGRGMPS